MTTSTDQKIRITTEAVHWLRRLEAEPTPETAEQFKAWLSASPLHLESFLKQSEIEEAMRRTRAQPASEQPVVSVSASVPAPGIGVVKDSGHPVVWGLVAPLLLIGLWLAFTARAVSHRTEGSSDVAHFSRGSLAKVFPDTQLRELSVALLSRITVDRGGGEFHVHHRQWQRFSVRAGGALITAKGTVFNVLFRAPEGTGVYVTEGAVSVEGRFGEVLLRAGDSVFVSPDGFLREHVVAAGHVATPSDDAPQSEWINSTLAAIAEEINRRSRTPQIEVQGAARERNFQGDVPLNNPRAWVKALATYSDLEIERQPGKVTIRQAGAIPRE